MLMRISFRHYSIVSSLVLFHILKSQSTGHFNMGTSHLQGLLKVMALLTVPKVWSCQALIRARGENLAVGGGWKPRMFWTEGPSPSWLY